MPIGMNNPEKVAEIANNTWRQKINKVLIEAKNSPDSKINIDVWLMRRIKGNEVEPVRLLIARESEAEAWCWRNTPANFVRACEAPRNSKFILQELNNRTLEQLTSPE